MKKVIVFIASLFLLVSLIGSFGCSAPAPTTTTTPTTTSAPKPTPLSTATTEFPLKDWPANFVMSHIGTGGSTQAMAVGMAAMMSKYLKVRTTTTSVGGGGEGVEVFYKKQIDSLTGRNTDTNYFAARGIEEYAGRGPAPLRVLAAKYDPKTYESPGGKIGGVHALTWKGSGVKTIAGVRLWS